MRDEFRVLSHRSSGIAGRLLACSISMLDGTRESHNGFGPRFPRGKRARGTTKSEGHVVDG